MPTTDPERQRRYVREYAARNADKIKATRTKTAVTAENVDTVKRLRASGATIAAIVTKTGMSRASVYRALDAD